jgi:hypothetical protein
MIRVRGASTQVRRRWTIVVSGALLAIPLQAQDVRPGEVTRPPVRVAPRSLWLVGLTSEQAWDSNVQFLEGDDPDNITRHNGFVTLIRARPRSRLALTGTGTVSLFQKRTVFNNYAANVALEGSRSFTARSLGTSSVFYQRRLSNDIFGAVGGLPLLGRLAVQEAFGGNATLLHRVSLRSSARLDATYAAVRFDQPFLIPGEQVSVRGQLTHLYRRTSSLLINAEAQEGNALGNPLSLQSVGAGWQPAWGNLQFRFLAAGTRVATGGEPAYLPTGLAEVSDSVGKGVARASYSRSASQAFGLGRYLVNDVATVAYDFQARRGNLLSVGAATANSREAGGEGVPFRAQSVTAAYRRIWENGFTLGVGASYRNRDDFLRASALSGNLSLGYTARSR